MTPRQRRFHERMRLVSSGLKEHFATLPLGYSMIARLPPEFSLRRDFPLSLNVLDDTVIVTRHHDGLRYEEHSLRFYRKGQTKPRPRLLPAGLTA